MLVRIHEYISWKKARSDKKLELHPGEYRRVYQGNMEGRVEEILTEKTTEKKTGYQLADYDIVTLSTREEFTTFYFYKNESLHPFSLYPYQADPTVE
ncbi:hypothetical protein RZN22_09265 [Bacillaceae bacterium S4-13-58]